MENFLKIEDGVSPTVCDEHRNVSKGTYKGLLWGSVIALCCLFPVAALLRSHTQATADQHPGNNAGSSQLSQPSSFIAARPPSRAVSPLHAYVPSGMSKEEWANIQKKEKEAKSKKKFGLGGARGFESRSMQSFQEARERGEADHLFPVSPADVASGKIALKDVPYMQRGGSWRNTDLKKKGKGWMTTGFGMRAFNDGKAKTMKENKYDEKNNGAKPSISIFGGEALDWTGLGARGNKDTVGARAAKNGISKDQQMWRDAGALSEKEIRAKNAPKINFGEVKEKAGGFFGWR
jgi:hypothetical protein